MKNKTVTAADVRQKLLTSTGQFVKASWRSNPKPAASFKEVLLEKHTIAIVQTGVNFANLSSVKQGIADGERGEVQELPWGSWFIDPVTEKSWFPYVITHRSKGSDEDTLYLRLYPSGADNHIPKSVFLVDGVTVDKNVFARYLTPSESKKLLDPTVDKPLCFTIKLKNLLDIPQDVIEG